MALAGTDAEPLRRLTARGALGHGLTTTRSRRSDDNADPIKPPLEDHRNQITPPQGTPTDSKRSATALAGVDVDVLQPELAAAVAECAKQILGPTPLVRIGRAPKVLLAYRLQRSLNKMQTPGFYFSDDLTVKETKVEVLLRGQHFVGYGVHPDTMSPYGGWRSRRSASTSPMHLKQMRPGSGSS